MKSFVFGIKGDFKCEFNHLDIDSVEFWLDPSPGATNYVINEFAENLTYQKNYIFMIAKLKKG